MGEWFSKTFNGNNAKVEESVKSVENISAINSTVIVNKIDEVHQKVHEKLDTVIEYGINFFTAIIVLLILIVVYKIISKMLEMYNKCKAAKREQEEQQVKEKATSLYNEMMKSFRRKNKPRPIQLEEA
jgi:large-conductance mechanosensitive channel